MSETTHLFTYLVTLAARSHARIDRDIESVEEVVQPLCKPDGGGDVRQESQIRVVAECCSTRAAEELYEREEEREETAITWFAVHLSTTEI